MRGSVHPLALFHDALSLKTKEYPMFRAHRSLPLSPTPPPPDEARRARPRPHLARTLAVLASASLLAFALACGSDDGKSSLRGDDNENNTQTTRAQAITQTPTLAAATQAPTTTPAAGPTRAGEATTPPQTTTPAAPTTAPAAGPTQVSTTTRTTLTTTTPATTTKSPWATPTCPWAARKTSVTSGASWSRAGCRRQRTSTLRVSSRSTTRLCPTRSAARGSACSRCWA